MSIGDVGRRTRPPVLESVLLLGGVVITAVGAPVARSGSLRDQLPLFGAVVVLAAVVALLARRSGPSGRRFAALATILLLLVAIPVTRIPSPGETVVLLGAVFAGLAVFGLVGAPLRLPPVTIPAGALLALLGAVTAVSPDRFALLRYAPFVLATVPVFLLAAAADGAVRVRVARFLVLLAGAEAVLAVVEPFIGAPQLWTPAKISAAGLVKTLPNPFLPDLVRAQGTSGHPLVLGVLLLLAVALLVGDAVRLRARWRAGAAVLLVAGLLASGSRNSLLLAGLLALVFLPRWRLGRRAVLAVVGLLVAVAVAAAVAAPVLARWFASGSATHRIGALDALVSLLRQGPLQLLLGNGWASSSRLFEAGMLQTDGLKAVDDEFVLLLSQGGVVAVLLLVVVLVLVARRTSRVLAPALVAVIGTFLVFDLLAWPVGAALTAGVLAVASTSGGRSTRAAQAPETERVQRRAYSR